MKKTWKLFTLALVAVMAVGLASCGGHKHKYEVVEQKDATCLEDGLLRERCKKCGDTRETVTPALGHKFGVDNKCERCGFELVATKGLAYIDTEDETAYLVALGTATDTEIIVPAYQRAKPVVGILAEGFASLSEGQSQGGKLVESITLPDGLLTIGTRAFYGCTSLKTLELPQTLTSVGELAFSGCTSLKTVTGGRSLIEIGSNAFYGCTALTALPSSLPAVRTVGNFAFASCSVLDSANFGDALEQLGEGVFADCTSLRYATVAGKLSVIPKNTFENCTALLEVRMSSSLKEIGSVAFGSCDSLQSIRFGGTMAEWKSVARAADWMASRLDYAQFPDYYVYCTDGKLDRYDFEVYSPQN